MIHGFVISACAIYDVYYLNAWDRLDFPNNSFEKFWGSWSYAYFMVDSIMMIYLNIHDAAILLHHAVIIIGYTIMLYTGYGGPVQFVALYAGELSNLPMHIRQLLKGCGRRNTNIYDVFEWSYFILYFYGRLIVALILCYRMT